MPKPGAERDRDGNSRLLNGDLLGSMRVDMGAFELGHVTLAITGNPTPNPRCHWRGPRMPCGTLP